uniref:Uncharacterized protein n=1 Tax=Physcomitrium patens TaxID=3218 RepID=A0A2K1L8N2_PHYPA|nr:hypothetical protein PHYPA_000832 [Physcomitrium patens]
MRSCITPNPQKKGAAKAPPHPVAAAWASCEVAGMQPPCRGNAPCRGRGGRCSDTAATSRGCGDALQEAGWGDASCRRPLPALSFSKTLHPSRDGLSGPICLVIVVEGRTKAMAANTLNASSVEFTIPSRDPSPPASQPLVSLLLKKLKLCTPNKLLIHCHASYKRR